MIRTSFHQRCGLAGLLFAMSMTPPRPADAQNTFSLAAVGDLIISRPISQLQQEGAFPGRKDFAAAVALLAGADAVYGNLETSIVDIRSFAGAPYSWDGDWVLSSLPSVADDIKALHVNIVSRSNNHALDWGVEGMHETSHWVRQAGLADGGIGETAQEAAAAGFYESAKGRIAIVSMVSTYRPTTNALDRSPAAPHGRPGVNGLTIAQGAILDETRYRQVAILACQFAGGSSCARSSVPKKIDFFGTEIRAAFAREIPFTYSDAIDPADEARIMAGIKAAKSGSNPARYVIASIHAHEGIADEDPPASWQNPARFLTAIAHAAIDSGADVFIATGIHHLGGMEIYKQKPIFYGIGNFVWSDIQEPLSEELYGSNAVGRVLERSFQHPERATDNDLSIALDAEEFATAGPKVLNQTFQSVLLRIDYDDTVAGHPLKEVRLYPIDLGYGAKLTRIGIPRLSSNDDISKSVLDRIVGLSNVSAITFSRARENGYLIGIAVPKASEH
jgi:poly-gamma-glutamate capsule biosynthesis protein CapA/YwtB (metallophosphatase superfamily)